MKRVSESVRPPLKGHVPTQQYSAALLATLLLLVLACTGDLAKPVAPAFSILRSDVVGNLGNPGVLPPQSDAFGKSYGEWAGEWWKWLLKQPVPTNPDFDTTGSECANGQSGHVWFLQRIGTECIVPTGKALVFLVPEVEFSNAEAPGASEAELRALSKAYVDLFTDLVVEVDGVAIQTLANYRVPAPGFSFVLPDDNLLQLEGVTAPAGSCFPLGGTCVDYLGFTDGYFFLLAPLSPGVHEIHVHGLFNQSPTDRMFKFTVASD